MPAPQTIEELRMSGMLPSPKGVALAVLELCQREDSTMDEVAHVIMADPAMSGRLIRQANAASQGGRAVAGVPEAVRRLGLKLVKQLTLGFSLIDEYGEGACAELDYQAFWSHSLLMGLAMQALGRISRIGPPDDLFACGLLARIGRLALATAYPEPYSEVLAAARGRPGAELAAMEGERLGIDHSQLSVALLGDWGFPPALVEPVGRHEAPEEIPYEEGTRGYQLTQSLYLASRIGDLGLASEAQRVSMLSDLLLVAGRVGMDESELGSLLDPLIGEWREWGALLSVRTGEVPPFAEIASAPAPRPTGDLQAEALRVLVVDDEASARMMMRKLLSEQCGHQVQCAASGREALGMALEHRPQVVLTDWMMPEMDGLALCKALRSTDWGRAIYVVMLTGMGGEDRLVEAFAVGVDDFLTKPVSVRALKARLHAAWRYVKLQDEWERDRAQLKRFAAELAVSNRKLEQAALTDALTGLPNRRAGIGVLEQAWSASRRSDQPLSVMVIDIDGFKGINDTHGHASGDAALAQVARILRESARKDDWLCRMGGEEFLGICPNTTLAAAAQSAERLRRTVYGTPIRSNGGTLKLSVSIGLAARESATPDADQLVAYADKALYAAKNAGRNRCCVVHEGKVHLGPAPA